MYYLSMVPHPPNNTVITIIILIILIQYGKYKKAKRKSETNTYTAYNIYLNMTVFLDLIYKICVVSYTMFFIFA